MAVAAPAAHCIHSVAHRGRVAKVACIAAPDARRTPEKTRGWLGLGLGLGLELGLELELGV